MDKIITIHNEHLNDKQKVQTRRNKIRKFAEKKIDWNIKAKELHNFYKIVEQNVESKNRIKKPW